MKDENEFMRELKKEIEEQTYFFICECCDSCLFNSHNIISLYIIRDKEFAFVIDGNETSSFTFDSELQTQDDLLSQIDCAYYKCFCSTCKKLLGSQVILSSEEKLFLCDTIVIKNDFLKVIKHFTFSLMQTKLKFSFDSIKNNSTILAINEIQDKIKNGVKVLNEKLSSITRGRELLNNVSNIIEEKQRLEKVFEYLKYLTKTNKSSTIKK